MTQPGGHDPPQIEQHIARNVGVPSRQTLEFPRETRTVQQSAIARTVALRGAPSKKAISPNTEPSAISQITRSEPPGPGTMTRTAPDVRI